MSITSDFPLLPTVIADCVLDEVARATGELLPRPWADRLADYAETVYANNATWSARLRRSRPEVARESLYVFMRHWVSAWLKKERPDLFAKLPYTFPVGQPIPPAPLPRNP